MEGGGDDVFEAGFGDFEIGELVVLEKVSGGGSDIAGRDLERE